MEEIRIRREIERMRVAQDQDQRAKDRHRLNRLRQPNPRGILQDQLGIRT